MSDWLETNAYAKLNLSHVVGPARSDGKHEVMTVLQRIELADSVAVRRADPIRVDGFAGDTLVREALEAIARRAGVAFEARIEKRIPIAAGLGGGSSDAGAALRLANALLGEPLPGPEVRELAAALGSDVPFFAEDLGCCIGVGDGSELTPIELPTDYAVVLVLAPGAVKTSTAEVYAAFDHRQGAVGFEKRRKSLEASLGRVSTPEDLAELPGNDLGQSGLAAELERRGAFRAGVSGAGPTVYGLFSDIEVAKLARRSVAPGSTTWLTRPVP